MTLYRKLTHKEFPIAVSLPANRIELAKVAVAGGADGVKVHLNCFHRASGNRFGSFAEEKPFLQELAKLNVSKSVMIGQETLPTLSELNALSEMGFECFNLYLHHAQQHIFQSKLRPFLALGHGFTEEDVRLIHAHPGSVIEASVVDPSDYGKELTEEDLSLYRNISRLSDFPAVVPTQKKILPTELKKLQGAGMRGLLIGVIVTGNTPESIEAATRAFVEERDQLCQNGSR